MIDRVLEGDFNTSNSLYNGVPFLCKHFHR